MSLFASVEPIRYEGPDSTNDLAFRAYDPKRVVLGKPMADWLRCAVCYWHSFNWSGNDQFGAGTSPCPWLAGSVTQALAEQKAQAAFDFMAQLGLEYYTFHDVDVMAEAATLRAHDVNLKRIEAVLAGHMQRTGLKLLWGTANLFSHPRYAAGAATNPDPEVFAWAAAQVRMAIELTHRLSRHDPHRAQAFRAHQAPVRSRRRDARCLPPALRPREGGARQHRGRSRHARGARLRARDRRGAGLRDPRFRRYQPRRSAQWLGHGSVPEQRTGSRAGDAAPAGLGGFATGGINFDPKLRRQSVDPTDLYLAHIGGVDTLARALLAAARIIEERRLAALVEQRYAGWSNPLGRKILDGELGLAALADHALQANLAPAPRSGKQELCEAIVAAAAAR
jgi:xylose isomerase